AYYDFDMTGSTVGMTNAAGAYVNRYSYLPFGETRTLTAGVSNLFTYVGRFGVTADASGLLHMGLRDYTANTGQFTSRDPAGLSGGDGNLRRYGGNSPVSLIDPKGLRATDAIDQLDKAESQSDELGGGGHHDWGQEETLPTDGRPDPKWYGKGTDWIADMP